MTGLVDRYKKISEQLVNETTQAAKDYRDTEIQPKSEKELNRMAFDAMLKDVQKLEGLAGLK